MMYDTPAKPKTDYRDVSTDFKINPSTSKLDTAATLKESLSKTSLKVAKEVSTAESTPYISSRANWQ